MSSNHLYCNTGASLKALLFAASPGPLLLPAIGCSLYFPFYCLWLCCNGRCGIFVLHLIIFWRLLDIISHCIGGGLAEMMGDISCLSQWDGLCRACAFFSHSVMLCLGMCRGSSSMGRERSPLKHDCFHLWQEATEQAKLLVFPGWTDHRAGSQGP